MPIIAFWLGVLSFALFFFLGEGFGMLVMVPGMTAYFFLCQFLLSRGAMDAWREDWLTMVALNVAPVLLVVMAMIAEKKSVAAAQASVILLPSFAGTFAGAWTASLLARRAGGRREDRNHSSNL